MDNLRLKFRFWHKPTQKMMDCYGYNEYFVFGDTLDGIGTEYNPAEFEDCILMQCTGLKDKNGTLIYEGDIVNQIHEDNTIHKCEVVYNNCSFQLKHIEKDEENIINTPMYCYSINYLGHYTEKKLEVIGNIYESEISDGRSETSPDSEQMEQIGAKPRQRHSVSVEEFQDNKELLK